MVWLFFALVFSSNSLSAQTQDPRLVTSKEGTLIVNYWSSAPDPEVEKLKALMVDAISTYLNGAIDIVEGDVKWKASERVIKKDMNKIIRDMMLLRKFKEKVPFDGFSNEVNLLLTEVQELDSRDVLRFRNASDVPFEKRFYFLVQSRIQEVILQSSIELGSFVNHGLLALVGVTEEVINSNDLNEWQTFDPSSPLKPIEIDFSLETMSLIDSSDLSELPASLNSPIIHNSDISISIENVPKKFEIRFFSASSELSLNSHLYLNEVVGLLCRFPTLRIICTGHSEIIGKREVSLELSKERAVAVRDFILASGIASERVVMNYFGEELAENNGAKDRRVIITFFAD